MNTPKRRNLAPYVRVSLALELESTIAARAKENQIERKGEQSGASLTNSSKLIEPINTRAEIAKTAGVSEDTVAKVKTINAKASENERALVGARMANLRKGGAGGATLSDTSMDVSVPAITQERAAELSGSSIASIQRAKAIVKEGIPDDLRCHHPPTDQTALHGAHRRSNGQNFDTISITMESYEPTDKISLQQWHEQQHLDDEPEIVPPVDPLDPQTVLAMLMLICVPSERGLVAWRTATRRLALIAHAMLPEIGCKSLDQIARQLTDCGIPTTRAALSVSNVQLYEATGLRRTEKTDKARASYKARAHQCWQKRERKTKTVSQESETIDNQ